MDTSRVECEEWVEREVKVMRVGEGEGGSDEREEEK